MCGCGAGAGWLGDPFLFFEGIGSHVKGNQQTLLASFCQTRRPDNVLGMHVFGALVLTCFPRVENLSTLVEKTELRSSSKLQKLVQPQVQSEYIGRVLYWLQHFSPLRSGKWTTKHRSKIARDWVLAINSMNGAFQHVSSHHCKKVDAAKSGASLTWLDHAACARCTHTMVGECSTGATLVVKAVTVVKAVVNLTAGNPIAIPGIDLPGNLWTVTQMHEQGCNLLTACPSEALQQCLSKNSHHARWRETLDTYMVHGTTEHHVVMGYLYPSRW